MEFICLLVEINKQEFISWEKGSFQPARQLCCCLSLTQGPEQGVCVTPVLFVTPHGPTLTAGHSSTFPWRLSEVPRPLIPAKPWQTFSRMSCWVPPLSAPLLDVGSVCPHLLCWEGHEGYTKLDLQ